MLQVHSICWLTRSSAGTGNIDRNYGTVHSFGLFFWYGADGYNESLQALAASCRKNRRKL